ncbi:hypothetical protein [Paracoccus benzoatiresistens]|uniref:Uncharacterized protein n=1 Tax=Paracoccus benzoatiresistens TaxID=2997341 RepID=A0ABT4JAK7_9RHOB|nr:hypothetical protein [Paracoccus sp. EF6]MCZ0964090.1 hypothetical protein [Paracoccus sp. EF6]
MTDVIMITTAQVDRTTLAAAIKAVESSESFKMARSLDSIPSFFALQRLWRGGGG